MNKNPRRPIRIIPETYHYRRTDRMIWIEFPAKTIVCPRCQGTGTHVNPAVDGHGLTADELQDEDFSESYTSGTFDVTCEMCEGERVLPEVDTDRLTKRQRILWIELEKRKAEDRRAAMAERESRF